MSAICYGSEEAAYRTACAQAYEAAVRVQDLVPEARQAAAESLLLLVKAAGAGRTAASPEVHRLVDRLGGNGTGPARSLRAASVVRTAALCLTHPEHAERWASEVCAAADRLIADVTTQA